MRPACCVNTYAQDILPASNQYPIRLPYNQSMNNASMTHLGSLAGYSDTPAPEEGAYFKQIYTQPKYYNYNDPVILKMPWYANDKSAEFLNYTSQMNKGGFPATYKELTLSPIPDNNYQNPDDDNINSSDSVHEEINTKFIKNSPQKIEPFSWSGPGYNYTGISKFIWQLCLIFVIMLAVIWFMKKY